MVGGYKWDGKTGGGAVSFYLCQRCSAHLKEADRVWSDVADDEWAQHVKTEPNNHWSERGLASASLSFGVGSRVYP